MLLAEVGVEEALAALDEGPDARSPNVRRANSGLTPISKLEVWCLPWSSRT